MVNYYDAAGNIQSGTGTAPVVSMSAVSAISNGTAMSGGVCRPNHVMQVNTSAGVSAGVVQLQGSLDGANWWNMPGTSTVTTAAANTAYAVPIAGVPASFVRATITTTITGGTVTVLVGSCA